DVPRHGRVAPADDLLDLGPHLLQVDAQALQRLGGDAGALADQAQQQVLGAHVVVIEAARLFLGQDDDPLGALGISSKHATAPSSSVAKLSQFMPVRRGPAAGCTAGPAQARRISGPAGAAGSAWPGAGRAPGASTAGTPPSAGSRPAWPPPGR